MGNAPFDADAYRKRWLEDVYAGVDRALVQAEHVSIIRRQAELLLELMDQRIGRERIVPKVFGSRRIAQLLDHIRHCITKVGKASRQDMHDRDLEVAGHLQLELELAQMIFMHPQTVFQAHVHGDSPTAVDVSNRIDRAIFAHRQKNEDQ